MEVKELHKADKKKIMISFQEGKENGGPYTSHKRIMNSRLKEKYEYVAYTIPSGRIGLVNIKLLRNLIAQIKKENPDLVHIHGLQLAGFYYALAAFLCRKPIVLVVRGSVEEAIEFSKWKKYILSILEIITLRISNVVYGVSDYVCNWSRVKRHAGKRLYGTVYNMMQLEDVATGGIREQIRKELGISQEDTVVVSTGRITVEKGFEILCEAIIRLKEDTSLKYVIVGEGDYLDEFKQRIEQENLMDKVFFVGYQKNVNPFLMAADIFVICSLHETLCNSLIEAGAMGLPLVAPRVGGIPEIVKQNLTGILLEENTSECAADAIHLLCADAKLRQEYGNKAREYIEATFTQDVIVKKIEELYRKVDSFGG